MATGVKKKPTKRGLYQAWYTETYEPDPQRQVAFYHLLGQREANGPGGPYWHSKNTEVDGTGKEPDVTHQVPSNWYR